MIVWWVAMVTFIFGGACGVVFMAGRFELHARRESQSQDATVEPGHHPDLYEEMFICGDYIAKGMAASVHKGESLLRLGRNDTARWVGAAQEDLIPHDIVALKGGCLLVKAVPGHPMRKDSEPKS